MFSISVYCLIINYTDGIIYKRYFGITLSFNLLLDFTIIVTFLSIDYVEYVIVLAQATRRDNDRTQSNWELVYSLLIIPLEKIVKTRDGASSISFAYSDSKTRLNFTCDEYLRQRENVREISLTVNRNVSTDTCHY